MYNLQIKSTIGCHIVIHHSENFADLALFNLVHGESGSIICTEYNITCKRGYSANTRTLSSDTEMDFLHLMNYNFDG